MSSLLLQYQVLCDCLLGCIATWWTGHNGGPSACGAGAPAGAGAGGLVGGGAAGAAGAAGGAPAAFGVPKRASNCSTY